MTTRAQGAFHAERVLEQFIGLQNDQSDQSAPYTDKLLYLKSIVSGALQLLTLSHDTF